MDFQNRNCKVQLATRARDSNERTVDSAN